jgi:hypothetical protein
MQTINLEFQFSATINSEMKITKKGLTGVDLERGLISGKFHAVFDGKNVIVCKKGGFVVARSLSADTYDEDYSDFEVGYDDEGAGIRYKPGGKQRLI